MTGKRRGLKFMAAGILVSALAYQFNPFAAPPKTPEDAPKPIGWSEMVNQAKAGQYSSVDIYPDHVIASRYDSNSGRVIETEAVSPSPDIAYQELKPDVKNISFEAPKAPAKDAEKSSSGPFGPIGGFLGGLLLSVGVGVLTLVVAMRIMGGVLEKVMGGGAAAKLAKADKYFIPVDPADNKTRFTDVAGSDEAKFEIQEVVDFLKNPKKFRRLGAKCPKGVLMSGPPGTGKTLLARAVAGEAGVPFFEISGSNFIEMFVGVGAQRVRDLFEQARKHAAAYGAAIIFIDELDAIGKTRSTGGPNAHEEREQTLNQLLTEMDGFNKDGSNIIMLGATNRPEILDPALLRPGRFDRQVKVELADVEGRAHILKVHSADKPVAAEVNLHDIARSTPGFSGADLANIMNEAAINCGRRDDTQISTADIRNAVDKVGLGVATKITKDPLLRQLYAYHEAGHVLGLLHEPDAPDFDKVTIVPRGRTGGHASWLPKEDGLKGTVGQMEAKIRIAVAGRVAERLIFGDNNVTSGASGDIDAATDIARSMITDYGMSKEMGMFHYGKMTEAGIPLDDAETTKKIIELAKKKIDEAEAFMTEVLTKNLAQLHAIAGELNEKETLDSKQVRALVTITRVEDPRLKDLKPGVGVQKVLRLTAANDTPTKPRPFAPRPMAGAV